MAWTALRKVVVAGLAVAGLAWAVTGLDAGQTAGTENGNRPVRQEPVALVQGPERDQRPVRQIPDDAMLQTQGDRLRTQRSPVEAVITGADTRRPGKRVREDASPQKPNPQKPK